eukprot:gnl/MRDRNA2_/MRDRNA2_115362_c0_seq1.p1 gnl/MRDRNA2_/MRDRNA2_115362_c0~~gnl/MRDRNA2_/MRDRNA2_115362_c0_seq1.p1  ORF type:complete len:686 (+),score=125.89 gnl/MRDRNA2_/MRDRNA2_115362_c0_seq1:133-2190(+)
MQQEVDEVLDGPAEEEKTMLTLDKGETVYNYALYLPPIIRHKHGNFQNWDMTLGVILLFVNVAMQIGLTFIVGQGVIFEGNSWRFSLVGMDLTDQVEEGQVSKDANQMGFLQMAFPNFPGQSTPDDVFSDFSGDTDELSKRNNELIEKWKMRLSHDKAERAKVESGYQWSNRKKALSFAQLESEKQTWHPSSWQSPEDEAAAAALNFVSAGEDPLKKENKGGGGFVAGRNTLCTMKDATYNCLPPSVRFADQWDALDANGDGIWSLEEAEDDANGFEKKFRAKPFLVFRAITVGLTDRVSVDPNLWVAPEVTEMRAIPKPYFDYWMGDAALCSYADPKVCGTLLDRGFFGDAFKNNTAGKNIQDIDGALDYCVWMLTVNGGCDQSLPQIYKLFRAQREAQCGHSHLYNGGLYRNPHHDVDKVYVTAVWYEKPTAQIKGTTAIYLFFLFLVLQLWFLALVNEMRELVIIGEFTYVFPAAGEDGGLEVSKTEEGDEEYTITGITSGHRSAVFAMLVLRALVVVYLGVVGCIFLVMETGYMDLLMNAVALAFVLEIDEILFGAVARATTAEELEATKDLEFETTLPTTGCANWVLQKDFWGIVMFPIITIAIMYSYQLFVASPVLDALNCACYQLGSQCHEAQTYNKDWWSAYWSETLPNAMAEIAKFKLEAEPPMIPVPAPAPAPLM